MTGDAHDPEARATYAEFGEAFFAHAVTAGRITGALAGLAGDEIAFGPIGVGPGRVARVTAQGRIGEAGAARVDDPEIVRFRLAIPVDLQLRIDLGVDVHEFAIELEVGLDLVARAAPPLRVVVDVTPPTWRDVHAVVEPDGMRAAVLQRVAGVDREVRRFVARYVAREIDKPHVRAARDIDVAARIDAAWRA